MVECGGLENRYGRISSIEGSNPSPSADRARRQFIQAGLVDELSIHVAPVLLGAGTAMFEGLPDEHLTLESIETTQTEKATHLRYRVAR